MWNSWEHIQSNSGDLFALIACQSLLQQCFTRGFLALLDDIENTPPLRINETGDVLMAATELLLINAQVLDRLRVTSGQAAFDGSSLDGLDLVSVQLEQLTGFFYTTEA